MQIQYNNQKKKKKKKKKKKNNNNNNNCGILRNFGLSTLLLNITVIHTYFVLSYCCTKRVKFIWATTWENVPSDLSAQRRLKIRAFVVLIKNYCILGYAECPREESGQIANAQADLNLRWVHMSEDTVFMFRPGHFTFCKFESNRTTPIVKALKIFQMSKSVHKEVLGNAFCSVTLPDR